MYLKSIEVQGFKSFANKITFQFHNGITGIVGPNGSGKSNVADAVRWVLGEKSAKQLRGASMQDVIFSGTEIRKPLGYAFVSITLDNSDHSLAIDYDEVTVSRRLYRSGESEYMLNGTICRLKDVNELFYDTGIGKEGYSIIGQGQIERILSGKPEERRELFDEAAGIVKFKRRKSASLKKLEEEQLNLTRVNDILVERERQLGPLERQAAKARVFLDKREALKHLDVNVFLLENVKTREQLDEVTKSHKIAEADLEETTASYERIKTEYESIQEQLEQLQIEIEDAKASILSTDVTRSRLEGEIGVLREQIHSAEDNEEHLNKRIADISAVIASKQGEQDSILEEQRILNEKLEELEVSRSEAVTLLAQLQGQMEELNARIEADKNRIMDALNNRATIKSRMGRYDTIAEQIAIRKAEINSRVLRAKSDEEAQIQIREKLKTEFQEIADGITALEKEKDEKEKQLVGLREQLSAKDKKLQSTQVDYHKVKSKLDTLVNLTERYDGYGGAVKAVMEYKEREKGIIGVAADIIHVGSEYEVAIETALGGHIQDIVTEDEDTAKKMIAVLKQNKSGRATFLPLTSIGQPQEFKNEEALKEHGVIGMADTLVQTEPKYRSVAKALLGRILVVDHIDNAVKIARKFRYSIRMVTLEGELIVPGGAISGGAFSNNSNLLGRRREIEALEAKLAEIRKALDQIQAEIEEIKEKRNTMRVDVENIKGDLQSALLKQNTIRLNMEQADQKKTENEEGFDELKSEQQQLEEDVREIELKKEEIRQQLLDSEQFEEQTKEVIAATQKELEELRKQEAEQAARVNAWDLEVEKIRQKANFHQQNVDRILGEMGTLERELKEVQDGLSMGREDIERRTGYIEELQKTIEASFSVKTETEVKLKEQETLRDDLNSRQKTFFARREELADRKGNLDKEVYRLATQKERLESGLESQINYMWDEYEITLSDAAALRDENLTDLGEMKSQISELKDEIRKLGDVNVNAIEDFRNLQADYNFLKVQRDDLVSAEQTLKDIIEQLDQAMRTQFSEKFAQINKEFDKVFKELFGGGHGKLELMEDEDMLEAGILIVAQPPGKKLVNMMQMSGGEKALTAIALLFAIQNLKPSPFCLLDEIEAALDENNVARFANYLHKLTKNTQFIVITHRRGTMEKVDRLYGITMQEKGVSTLVSVNLIDKDLED